MGKKNKRPSRKSREEKKKNRKKQKCKYSFNVFFIWCNGGLSSNVWVISTDAIKDGVKIKIEDGEEAPVIPSIPGNVDVQSEESKEDGEHGGNGVAIMPPPASRGVTAPAKVDNGVEDSVNDDDDEATVVDPVMNESEKQAATSNNDNAAKNDSSSTDDNAAKDDSTSTDDNVAIVDNHSSDKDAAAIEYAEPIGPKKVSFKEDHGFQPRCRSRALDFRRLQCHSCCFFASSKICHGQYFRCCCWLLLSRSCQLGKT